jgi:AcrR family transcriptional regulator
MRSVQDDADSRGDLTARARIRDAAVDRFARDGFGVGLRAIADDAGVSAALIIHHFGSKDGLRAACDDHVLRIIAEAETTAVAGTSPDQVFMQMATLDEWAPVTGYALRSLQAGGSLARSFLERFISDAESYLAAGVAAGTIQPTRDERARARFVTLVGFGALLLDMTLSPPDDPGDLGGYLRGYLDRMGYAGVELYTNGLFSDRRMLDAYLLYVGDPPATAPSSL